MNFKDFGNFEEFARFCGYTNNEDTSSDSSEGCSDIPNGFQGLDPMLVTVIGELLGNIIAGNLPFNIQNLVGNWLQLVGQSILTFNAQQQYFQNGPGRYFNVKNFNITNPFCPENSIASSDGGSTAHKYSSKNKSSKDTEELRAKIKELQQQLNELNKIVKNIDK